MKIPTLSPLFAAILAATLLHAVPVAAGPMKAKSLEVVSPTEGELFYNGATPADAPNIIVKAIARPGQKPPVKSVFWDITCISCVPPGATPTHVSDFVDPDFTQTTASDNITGVSAPNKMCASVRLEPMQPGWTWSPKVCFTWVDGQKVNIKQIHPVGVTYPYPKIPNPGPVKPETAPQTTVTH